MSVFTSSSPAATRAPLTTRGVRWRLINLVFLPGLLLGLALVSPDVTPKWLPFSTSCGAITGLPCIFCGTTRALHCLLEGDFGRALYFNWLSYPILLLALGLLLLNTAELLLKRNLIARLPRPRFNRARAGAATAGLVLLWLLQVYLALSQHKTELLNPSGPLYSLVWTR